MGTIAEAVLEDGRRIPYVIEDNPPRGGMKYTYFAPDRSYVVQFYNDPNASRDEQLRMRLKAILGQYNPTLAEKNGGAAGNSEILAEYFSQRFCWPLAIVQFPELGIVCPTYPDEFFFTEHSAPQLKLAGKDKKSHWFTSMNRDFLSKDERGDLKAMLRIAILLTRSVRRLHQAGLAHTDLSNNNVLISPKDGNCIIIDIDSLVVPNMFPPEVIGTRGYIAPEVLATLSLDYRDPRRRRPSTQTDLYALGVLLYEYLFFRHPLLGPKVHSTVSAGENDFLALGPKAVFVEDPDDSSNRPTNLAVTIKDVGPFLESLFLQLFVNGLHDPQARPSALEWERALAKTWDLLHKCDNPQCEMGYFVLYDENQPICPYCHTRLKSDVIRFHLKTEIRGKGGQWLDDGVIDISDGMALYGWHLFGNIFADEKADKTVLLQVEKQNDKWYLVNRNLKQMTGQRGQTIPKGESMMLEDKMVFRLSREKFSKVVYVTINRLR